MQTTPFLLHFVFRFYVVSNTYSTCLRSFYVVRSTTEQIRQLRRPLDLPVQYGDTEIAFSSLVVSEYE
jgi:hypothetical protein